MTNPDLIILGKDPEAFHKRKTRSRWLLQCPDCGLVRSVVHRTLRDAQAKQNSLCQQCATRRIAGPPPSNTNELIVLNWFATRTHALVLCPLCRVEFHRKRGQLRYDPHSFCILCTRRYYSGLCHHIKDVPDQIIILEQFLNGYRNAHALAQCPVCGTARPLDRQSIIERGSTKCPKCGSLRGEQHPCWRGGHRYYYDVEWEAIAAAIRERDDYTCQFPDCNEYGESLHVHHIIPYRESQDNSSDNLIALCRPHHTWADNCLDESIPMLQNIIEQNYW